jgi:Fur family ferric uptake transcriptional regulator
MQRKTQQRETIQDVLKDAARPLTVYEILERAAKKVPSLGIATVYRCVKALMESSDVTLVEIVGEPLRYESAHLEHHHHFVCDKCRKVFDVQGCAPIASLVPNGFKMREHEIVLYGVCAGCG